MGSMIRLRNIISTEGKRTDAFLVCEGKVLEKEYDCLPPAQHPPPHRFSPVTCEGVFESLHFYSVAFFPWFLPGKT